jgi:murein L,D-transpeptidase YcbB/YkuD
MASLLGMAAAAGAQDASSGSDPAQALRAVLTELPSQGASVRGTRLIQGGAVRRFFEARRFQPAWTLPAEADEILEAIRGIDRDGLTPADYHAEAIAAALTERRKGTSPELDAALQVLLADAVAGLLDHVRYGKVRPVTLDSRWNMDPRAPAPPLDTVLTHLVEKPSIGAAIEEFKPNHFIYEGLKTLLGRLRATAGAGGWPRVPAGPALKPGATDSRVAAVRKRLAASGELAAGTPDSPVYDAALEEAVRRFQESHRLMPDGVIGAATLEAMNVTAEARAAQVRVNLERARWVLGGLCDSFVLVNLPAFKVYLIRDSKPIWEARTQIGREARQTPAFRADMKYLVINPDWTVPPTILAQDVLAGMRRGENTIARKGLTILDRQGRRVDPESIDWATATAANFPYTLRQPPGPDNALGRVKFVFPNEYDIFLHDTPSQELFGHDKRTFSSGCIRVERALELADLLLADQEAWSPDRIRLAVQTGDEQVVNLRQPLPVLIVYWTVSVGQTGEAKFMRDVYGLDAAVLRALAN